MKGLRRLRKFWTCFTRRLSTSAVAPPNSVASTLRIHSVSRRSSLAFLARTALTEVEAKNLVWIARRADVLVGPSARGTLERQAASRIGPRPSETYLLIGDHRLRPMLCRH